MSIENRVAKLEKLAAERARQQSERGEFCGVIPFRVKDGFIASCIFVPCDRVPTWQEWGGLARSKSDCPDVLVCEYADVCRSGEAAP